MSKPPVSGPEGDFGLDSNNKTDAKPKDGDGQEKAMEGDDAKERTSESDYQ